MKWKTQVGAKKLPKVARIPRAARVMTPSVGTNVSKSPGRPFIVGPDGVVHVTAFYVTSQGLPERGMTMCDVVVNAPGMPGKAKRFATCLVCIGRT